MHNIFVTFFTILYHLKTPIAAVIIDQFQLESLVNLFDILRKTGKKIKTERKTETKAIHDGTTRVIVKNIRKKVASVQKGSRLMHS